MKRIIFILLSALVILSSCGEAQNVDLCDYQKYPMTVNAKVSADAGEAKISIHIASEDDICVSYTEPKILMGVSYAKEKDRTYMSFGGSQIDIENGELCLGSLSVARFFCLDPAGFSSSPAREEDGLWRIEYNSDDVTCVVKYGDGGPVEINGTANGFSATVSEIEIKYE